MVCINCQSKDVIKVQGDWFCTNCGTVQPTAAEAAQAASVTVETIEHDLTDAEVAAADLPAGVTVSPEMAAVIPTITNHARVTQTNVPTQSQKPQTKKRKVGRPKLARLDAPKSAAVAEAPTVTPVAVEAPLAKKRSVARQTSAHGERQPTVTDLSPRAGAAAEARAAKPAAEQQPVGHVTQPESKPASSPPKTHLHHPPINYAEIAAESWSGRFRPLYAALMALPAIVLALLAGGFVAAWLAQTPTRLAQITHAEAYAVSGEILLVLILYYASHTLASAALTFGIAREADHRPAPLDRWWGVAVNSFGAHLRLDSLTALLHLAGLSLVAALVYTGGVAWRVPIQVQIGALFVAFLVMLYLIAGIGLAQSLGRVSVTLGIVPAHRAIALGWDFFRHHIDLVGARLIGLVLDLAMTIPFIGVAVVLGLYAPQSGVWAAIAITMLTVVMVGALMGAGGAIWWQAVYRKLVRNERITEVMSLVAGRQAERPKRPQLLALGVFMSAIFVLAVVWPWLPLPKL